MIPQLSTILPLLPLLPPSLFALTIVATIYLRHTKLIDNKCSCSSPSSSALTLHPELESRISDSIEKWIESKGYTQRRTSINDVAAVVGTNRTYLSSYINSKYGCSFRVWITRLRIKRAKRLMVVDRYATLEEISSQVGFSSANSFVHSFKRYESIPPSQWRRGHTPTHEESHTLNLKNAM